MIPRILATAAAALVSALFLYPYAWMLSSAFRSTREILSAPLHLWPAAPNTDAFAAIADAGGTTLTRALLNSVFITAASTLLAIAVTALGAYAVTRRPHLPAFRLLRGGFLPGSAGSPSP